MKFIAAIAAIAFAAFASAQPTLPPIVNCATGYTDIDIATFTIAPYPLCVGKPVCAEGTGVLKNAVEEGGTLSIVGRYFGRVVYTDDYDLCELLGSQGFTCPLPTTMTSIKACVIVKPDAPTGIPVELTVEAINGNGNVLFCQKAVGVVAQNCP